MPLILWWTSKATLFPHRLPRLNIKTPVRTEQDHPSFWGQRCELGCLGLSLGSVNLCIHGSWPQFPSLLSEGDVTDVRWYLGLGVSSPSLNMPLSLPPWLRSLRTSP